jgi:hypothetical protein
MVRVNVGFKLFISLLDGDLLYVSPFVIHELRQPGREVTNVSMVSRYELNLDTYFTVSYVLLMHKGGAKVDLMSKLLLSVK